MDLNLESLPNDLPGLTKALDRLQRNIKRALNTAFSFNSSDSFEIRTGSGFPIFFTPRQLKNPARHLHLTYCRNESDDVPPTAGVFVDWIADGGKVVIRGISGLTSGKIYTLRFLVFD